MSLSSRIAVTKTHLPDIEKFKSYIDKIWATGHLTNHGPFLNQLEDRLKETLGVDYFYFVTNGTLALQMALRAFDLTNGDIITTPYSYVATTSSIMWEGCSPVFVDIDPQTFCINPQRIEEAITPKTRAIMAVHVYGNACDVEAIEDIARRHNLKVIYDGAHAFGSVYKGRSLLDYGDISTCSFHATKVFQTIEGGAVITHSRELHEKMGLLRSFGHIGDEHFSLGINAKASEFQAVMDLCSLDDYADGAEKRKVLSGIYDGALSGLPCQRPVLRDNLVYNHAYYAIAFETPERRASVQRALNNAGIFPRRYFYPSLNTLPYVPYRGSCPVSESLAQRVICLPLYPDLAQSDAERIATIIRQTL